MPSLGGSGARLSGRRTPALSWDDVMTLTSRHRRTVQPAQAVGWDTYVGSDICCLFHTKTSQNSGYFHHSLIHSFCQGYSQSLGNKIGLKLWGGSNMQFENGCTDFITCLVWLQDLPPCSASIVRSLEIAEIYENDKLSVLHCEVSGSRNSIHKKL